MSLTGTDSITSTKDAEVTVHGVDLASLDRLRATWTAMQGRRAARGRRGAVGIDGVRAEVFERELERNLREISRMLARRDERGDTAYRIGPLVARTLITPKGQPRTVYVPRARDQLVLRLAAEELAAAMRREGIGTAPPTFPKLVRDLDVTLGGHRFALRADIASCYASIPHAPLLDRLRALALPRDVFTLIERVLTAPIREPLSRAGSGATPTTGVPPGVSVSSLLNELYLSGVDEDLRALGLPFVRYVDDLLVLCPDVDALDAAEARVRASTSARELRLSEAKLVRANLDLGVPFVGLHVSLGGVRVDEGRIDRWVATRSRAIRSTARLVAAAESRAEAEDRLAELVARLNRDLSGHAGMLVPLVAATGQLDLLRRLDALLLTALGGIFRRLGIAPAGRFRLSRAADWGHRWQRSPKRAREAARRLFGEADGAA
jgi:hypothetical protein